MKKALIKTGGLAALMVICWSMFCFAGEKSAGERHIDIAGLVFNAETLLPVDSAAICDADNHVLGTTDQNGYFKVSINYTQSGAIKFSYKISKSGYQHFVQLENWGDLAGDPKAIMYFGLHQSGSKAGSFSDMGGHGADLSYASVLSGFDKVKAEKVFNDKLANAKAGNQHVLIQIDNQLYIVDNSGWIKINSEKNTILLNGSTLLSADKLNATIKRKSIRSMTPLGASQGGKFGIDTR